MIQKSHLVGALGAILFVFITVTANAAFIGGLPMTPGGTDYQAYYDDQLDITWTANASIINVDTWDNQVAWAAALDIDGVTGWRLPNMNINGDMTVVDCKSGTQEACKDNEYGHLFYYGAGTTPGGGVTAANPGPFSNVQSSDSYWSGTERGSTKAFALIFTSSGRSVSGTKTNTNYAWAVHSGDVVSGVVSSVPIPAAVWLFGSGLIGLLGIAKRKR